MVAQYPTPEDKKAFWRLPTLYKTVQDKNMADKVSGSSLLILTSGRLVEYEGGGEENPLQPLAGRAAAGSVRGNQPQDRCRPWHSQRQPRFGSSSPTGARLNVQALVTERVAPDTVWMPFHFSGRWQGADMLAYYPRGQRLRAWRGRERCNNVWLRQRDHDARNQDHDLQRGSCVRRSAMARMKFICDAERCIECNSCVTACKNEHEVPWGVNRRRVVTLNDGVPGEKSISVACMHCSDAPCMAVCPVELLLPHRRRCGAARQGCLHWLRLLQLCLPVRCAAVPLSWHLRCARQDGQVHLLRWRP